MLRFFFFSQKGVAVLDKKVIERIFRIAKANTTSVNDEDELFQIGYIGFLKGRREMKEGRELDLAIQNEINLYLLTQSSIR